MKRIVYHNIVFFFFKLITAEGSPIVLANQNASNGVIHVVDRVLGFPIPFLDIPQLIFREKARFSTLLTGMDVYVIVLF